MNRSVVGSLLLMFLVLLGSTAIQAARIQPVFAGAEDDVSSEERGEESYRAAAAKRIRRPHHLCAQISLLDIALRWSRETTRSALNVHMPLIDPHEFLRALRI